MPSNGKVFISHAHDDNPRCQPLLDALAAWGVDYWFDKERMDAGQAISRRIEDAIVAHDVFIRVGSGNVQQRPYWIDLETDAFRSLMADDENRGMRDKRRLITLVLDSGYVPRLFERAALMLDTTRMTQEQWLAELRRALGLASATSATSATEHTTAQKVADPTDFSNLFEEVLFGRDGRSTGITDMAPGSDRTTTQQTATRKAGEDIEQPVEITLREAYAGTTRSFTHEVTEACPTCKGSGKVGGRTCATCGGKGATTRTRKLEVNIPAGVDTSSKVRVIAWGQPGIGGAPAGDLYLLITVRPDASFERRGDDLQTNLQVPLSVAALGGEIPVQTIDGKRLIMTIPPETQNGQVFRLAGKGMPRAKGNGFGNLLGRVQIIMPTNLSPRERQIFEALTRERQE